MNKRGVGTEYEQKAVQALKDRGVEILACNYRNRYGEIDIIAREKSCICFIEVKYRTSKNYGIPEEAVDYRKKATIHKVADYYRMNNGIGEWEEIRFDVIAITEGHMMWHKNAF